VHGVIHLVLRLEHLFEAEVVMALLKRVEGDVLVMLGEGVSSARAGLRVGKLRLVGPQWWRVDLSGLQTETLVGVEFVVPVH